jgi:PAS domain S-box-containing protein
LQVSVVDGALQSEGGGAKPGSEVACRGFAVLLELWEEEGHPIELLTEGVDLPLSVLRDKKRRVDWETYCRMVRNARCRWGDEDFVRSGRRTNTSRLTRPFTLVAKLLVSEGDLYQWAFGSEASAFRHVFSCLEGHVTELEPGKLSLELRVAPGYAPCQELMLGVQGALESLPTTLGGRPARVNLHLSQDGGARFAISTSARRGLLRRAGHAFQRLFWASATARELRQALNDVRLHQNELEREIEERRRTEQALRESQEHLRLISDHTSDFIGLVTTDWKVLYSNRAWLQSFVGDSEQDRDADGLSRTHPDDLDKIRQSMELALREDRQITLTGRSRDLHGEWRWIEATVRPIPLARGERGIVIIGRDISDHRSAEAQIRRLNVELESRVRERTAELEAAVGELESFSYSVSHDLRGPLRALSGFASMLREDYGERLDEEGHRYLDRIEGAAGRLGELIDDLLALSRISQHSLTIGNVELGALAQEVIEELRDQDPERSVSTSIETQLEIRGDAGLLRIVVENLLGNAWKFTRKEEAPEIRFGRIAENPADEATFYVRDNGVGFDLRHAGKLFAPFERFHGPRDFEGTGIGLATVRRIVERHGGRVWAESDIGRGATFFFSLPTR